MFAWQFESVEDFLTQLALLTNVEAEEDKPPDRDDEQAPALDHPPGEGPRI